LDQLIRHYSVNRALTFICLGRGSVTAGKRDRFYVFGKYYKPLTNS